MRRLLACVALVLWATACSHGGGAVSPSVEHMDASPQATDQGRPVSEVRVGLTEWTILTSATQVSPGEVTLEVTNTGATAHDLVVSGRRGKWRSAHLAPGARARLDVRAAPGERLTLWCSLPGHDAQGMHTTVEVSR